MHCKRLFCKFVCLICLCFKTIESKRRTKSKGSCQVRKNSKNVGRKRFLFFLCDMHTNSGCEVSQLKRLPRSSLWRSSHLTTATLFAS